MQSFDDKLKFQRANDSKAFQEAIYDISGAIVSRRLGDALEDEQIALSAVDEILKTFYMKNDISELPPEINTIDEKIDYYMRPHGILRRSITLDKGWYKHAIWPMLTTRKSDGAAVALVPGYLSGYYYVDFETGKYVKITKKNEDQFDSEATFFYLPLPLRKLTTKDLILFSLKLMSASDFILYIGIMAVTTLLGLLVPVFTYLLFGPTIQSESIQVLVAVGIFMVCFACSQTLVQAYQSLINSRLGTKIDVAIEAAVMGRILSLPAKFFKDYSAGDLSQRATFIQELCKSFMSSVVSTSATSLFSLIYIFQIFNYAPSLAVPAITIILLTIFVTIFITLGQISINKKQMKLEALESGMTYALITGIQKIKLAGAERRSFGRWGKLYAKIAKYEYNPPYFLKLGSTIMLGISLIGTLVLYASAIYNNVSVADYYAFNTAYAMISGAFAGLSSVIGIIANIHPTIEMAKPIMETCPEITENKKIITRLGGGINIDHVSFRYREDMPLILDDFSLNVKPGEYLGIVGETGCGKSTLLRLLLGFELPQKGAVYYDKRSTEQIDLKSLCQNIGVVLQDGKLFIGDIYSNITISSPGISVEKAWEAAEIAQIADDIRQMPMGMYTRISEGQGGISGGQKQRLMIARAVVNKPRIIIMDESTSALDNLTQKNVADSIDSLKCTRIVIAHRLSTVKNCDRIVVMNKGKIEESGTYDELIQKNALFAELIKRQRLDIEC